MHEGFTSKNKDKTNLDIVICHEEKEFDAKQDNLNNKSILKILASKIEDESGNATRFLVMGKEVSQPEFTDKKFITSFLFKLKSKPAAL